MVMGSFGGLRTCGIPGADLPEVKNEDIDDVLREPLDENLLSVIVDYLESKSCYSNTAITVNSLLSYGSFGEDIRYVVGYADCVIPVEHCWIKIDDKYYDPTWELINQHPVDELNYLPVYEMTLDEVMQHPGEYLPDVASINRIKMDALFGKKLL